MRKTYHESIFYPSEKKQLLDLCYPLEKKEKKRAFIIPHQDLRKCYKSYQEVFSHIPDNSRIIALLPLHSEKLLQDSDYIAFESDDKIETPLGTIELEDLGLKKCHYYREEEYSAELIIPFVQTSCPHSTLALVYVSAKDASESKKVAHLIKRWDNNNTFFIISSNLTGIVASEDLKKEKEKSISMLENGQNLLDSYRKGQNGICASAIIDALSRVIPGKWRMLVSIDDDTITGHASFCKESN